MKRIEQKVGRNSVLNEHARVLKWLQESEPSASDLQTFEGQPDHYNELRSIDYRCEVRGQRKTVEPMEQPSRGPLAAREVSQDRSRRKTGKPDVTQETEFMPRSRTRTDTDSDGESVCSLNSNRSRQSSVSGSVSSVSKKSRASKMSKSHSMHGRNPKSGFLDKPRTCVLVKHMWPHMNQNA